MKLPNHEVTQSWSRPIMKSANHEVAQSWSLPIMKSPNHEVCQSWSRPIMKSANHEVCQSWSRPIMKSANHEVAQSWSLPMLKSPNHEVSQSWSLPILLPFNLECCQDRTTGSSYFQGIVCYENIEDKTTWYMLKLLQCWLLSQGWSCPGCDCTGAARHPSWSCFMITFLGFCWNVRLKRIMFHSVYVSSFSLV